MHLSSRKNRRRLSRSLSGQNLRELVTRALYVSMEVGHSVFFRECGKKHCQSQRADASLGDGTGSRASRAYPRSTDKSIGAIAFLWHLCLKDLSRRPSPGPSFTADSNSLAVLSSVTPQSRHAKSIPPVASLTCKLRVPENAHSCN
eukprot:2620490-Amphidinium_carterae.1